LQVLNARLWLLQRIVLHPVYRGAGLAAAFVRRACQSCPVDWIETLSALGHGVGPFFEKAGFWRIGVVSPRPPRRMGKRSGFRRRRGSAQSQRQSRFSAPIYYLYDNRRRGQWCPSSTVGADMSRGAAEPASSSPPADSIGSAGENIHSDGGDKQPLPATPLDNRSD
jgi:hypothetical protein